MKARGEAAAAQAAQNPPIEVPTERLIVEDTVEDTARAAVKPVTES
jgi:hypothetical protein